MIAQLWPSLYEWKTLGMVSARRAVKEREIAAGSAIEIDWQNFLKLRLSDLEESLRMERARREIIHRRALVFLGYAGIITALTLGALNLIGRDPLTLSLVLRGGLVLTVTFLFGSVWYAFNIIKPALVQEMYLQSKMNGGEPASDEERKHGTLTAIQLAQADNLILSIYAERSSRFFRNGLWCLFAMVYALVFVGMSSPLLKFGCGSVEILRDMLH